MSRLFPTFNEDPKTAQTHFLHEEKVELEFLQLGAKMDGVQVYCLSLQSPLSEFFPLPPIQNPNPMQVLAKPEGYICDFVELPKPSDQKNSDCNNVAKEGNIMRERMEKLLEASGIRKNNMFLRILIDFVYCLRGTWRILRYFIKR